MISYIIYSKKLAYIELKNKLLLLIFPALSII